jgi:two-component system copper resistance phosphate regulon response regulator CusR
MKILIIEDNREIARSLRKQLADDYVVEVATRAAMGLQKASANKYAVILLDLGLPDKSGLEVCRILRDRNDNTPILVLTAIDTVESRVSLLHSGADDYLCKPFNIAELRARIFALSRRQHRVLSDNTIIFKDVEINTVRREVMRSGKKINLRRKEYDILEYLIANKGRAVSREMIMNNVWESGKESWNNTIDVHIKHLRDRLDRPFDTKIIKTAYGIGYSVDDSLD